jgi:uncharacterized protein YxeA
MKSHLLIFSLILCISTSALASKHVKGYTKRDGTYVAPHHRSDPNKTQRDNYSSKPNVNPYNGKRGTKEPTH